MMIKLLFETNFYAKRDERMRRRMHRRRKCVLRDRPPFDAFLKRERERSEREVRVLKMRENSREGKIRWIKFNCCAKQTVLVKQKRKHISFLKNVSIFFRDESKARA